MNNIDKLRNWSNNKIWWRGQQDIFGQRYAFISDGIFMIWCKLSSDEVFDSFGSYEGTSSMGALAKEVLSSSFLHKITVTASSIISNCPRLFDECAKCEGDVDFIKCDNCFGFGQIECSGECDCVIECEDCKGHGKYSKCLKCFDVKKVVYREPVFQSIFPDCAIDPAYLRYMIEFMEETGEVQLTWCNIYDGMLLIQCNEWTGVLMSAIFRNTRPLVLEPVTKKEEIMDKATLEKLEEELELQRMRLTACDMIILGQIREEDLHPDLRSTTSSHIEELLSEVDILRKKEENTKAIKDLEILDNEK